MTFTYNAQELTTDLAKTRLEIGDTNHEQPLFTDEELNYFLAEEGGVTAAAARACEVLARSNARLPTFTADGLTVNQGALSAQYAALGKELRRRAGGGAAKTVSSYRRDGYSTTTSASN